VQTAILTSLNLNGTSLIRKRELKGRHLEGASSVQVTTEKAVLHWDGYTTACEEDGDNYTCDYTQKYEIIQITTIEVQNAGALNDNALS
jgi:hypothetical protein